MKCIYSLLATCMFSALIFSCTAQNKNVLKANDFEKAINSGEQIQILDVRTPEEFFSGHIKNAMMADWNNDAEFERRISFLDKSKPVYVYCLAGGRSAAAAKKMRNSGFTAVYELSGGTNAWRSAKKPLEEETSATQRSPESFNKLITSSKIVLVDFGAAWCPPCKQMEPILQNLTDIYKEKFSLIKVDAGRDQDLVQAYRVTALPVFIIFKDGKQVWRKDGIATESELAEQLK